MKWGGLNAWCFIIATTLTFGEAMGGVEERPNIIVVMVDDMGWSDLGCYGGEIPTPHIDSLARDGLRFTQFYNNAVCGPTRASLLTGLYSQSVGHSGRLWNEPKDHSKCVLIPEVLQANGYRTMMVGKWQGRDLAVQRGFDRFFGPNCRSKISYYHEVHGNSFSLDGDPWSFPEEGFFMTDVFNQYANDFLSEAVAGEDPFFLYLAYVAPHWPLHAPEQYVAPHRERYREKGWDDWREERLQRQKGLGLVADDVELAPINSKIIPWQDDPFQQWQTDRMAVYAAQISRVDQGVGTLLQTLEESGKADNTLVLFLSDNGAAPDGGLAPNQQTFGFRADDSGAPFRRDGGKIRPGSGPENMPGPPDTFAGYGLAWAMTSNTPFRDTKMTAYEGGIRTPLIARWPTVIKQQGEISSQIGHVIDLMPTCLEIAGIEYPNEFQGRHPIPMDGRSLLPIFHLQERDDYPALFFDVPRNQAVRMRDWKLVNSRRGSPWELYDLSIDPTERKNIADQHPEQVNKMNTAFAEWEKRVGAE
ncbi:Arylsulfatase [Polystyrenella longa]|uniref:Arylsulfatase n=1 Tax=Polystyrenella longa TaxID=2528007 RepID=A0A518CJ50_9PLAN|nr:arylsulfatase [Polystyrenella longa]QDU79224.1 Arylsulfatase [Polystyrenella longa]